MRWAVCLRFATFSVALAEEPSPSRLEGIGRRPIDGLEHIIQLSQVTVYRKWDIRICARSNAGSYVGLCISLFILVVYARFRVWFSFGFHFRCPPMNPIIRVCGRK